ncbi:hypothetical protein [Mycoplasmopsis glycophila]|uniref:Uncharacterized protein n=1 Tax=Mycoplasmopsis glycophila TaxID=171285 RepID=A0A449AUL8_9BACT|nr:hypothetical protein [Mycoplasmopsis glycophila]VEU70173.1 Uncharacterised protein [Mycoplasmopsis glycophila]
MNKGSNQHFSFNEMKNLALKNNDLIKNELKWMNKIVDASDITPNFEDKIVKVTRHGVDIETFLNHEIETLENNFEDLKNELNLETVCFMDKYNFESEQENLSLSLLDPNSHKNNQEQKNNMNNTTKIIVNKLDI